MVLEMIIKLISKSRGISHKSKTVADKNTFPRKRWFDQECKVQKRIVNNTRKTLERSPMNARTCEKYFREKKVYNKNGQEEMPSP